MFVTGDETSVCGLLILDLRFNTGLSAVLQVCDVFFFCFVFDNTFLLGLGSSQRLMLKLDWKYWRLCLMSHWFHTRIFLYFMLDLKWIYLQV